MAALGEPPYLLSNVATRYGAKDTRSVSVFRESLIQKGLIWSPRRGEVDFTVPSSSSSCARTTRWQRTSHPRLPGPRRLTAARGGGKIVAAR
jgi:hypothetical protein